MDDDLQVIENDPLARRKSVHRNGANPVLVFQPAFNLARDRFQVRLGSAGSNHEVIREARDALKIEDDNVLRFFVRRVVGAGFG